MPSWLSALNSRNNSDVFITLLTFIHESLAAPVYICSDPKQDLPIAATKGVISNGIEYVYIPFAITLPNLEKDTLPAATLSVDNINREILEILSGLTSPPEVQAAVVLASNPDLVEYSVQGLKLTNVTYNELTLDGSFTAEYYLSEPYPAPRFTPSRFPGMFRGRSINTND